MVTFFGVSELNTFVYSDNLIICIKSICLLAVMSVPYSSSFRVNKSAEFLCVNIHTVTVLCRQTGRHARTHTIQVSGYVISRQYCKYSEHSKIVQYNVQLHKYSSVKRSVRRTVL